MNEVIRDRRARPALLLALVVAGSLGLVRAAPLAQSARYRLEQATHNLGGATGVSNAFSSPASQGQEVAIGASCSPGYVLQSGFWGFAGSGVVPVVLNVDKVAVTGSQLIWSGNNSPYSIYRSTACDDVASSFLAIESTNSYPDPTIPAPGGLFCYQVVPTAPGPAVEPGLGFEGR